MLAYMRSLILLCSLLTACAHAPASVAPRPEDVASVDGMMKAFYDVVNVAPDAARQWDRDRTLYVPSIRFFAIDGAGKVSVYDHPSFVADTEPLIRAGFREREIARTTRRYGNMVHVDSAYETRRGRQGEDLSRGVNSIELYWDGTRWWISSVVWQSESAAFPIPPELLSTPTSSS
jgi:hypothetical protein